MEEEKKNNEVTLGAQPMNEKKPHDIPFGKAVRVGNFKIWRSKFVICSGRDKSEIETVNVSTIDGTWYVRIPSTYEMFGMVVTAYQWYNSDDSNEKERGKDYLFTVFTNMMFVSSVCNGFYHHGVQMVNSIYSFPDVLRDKKKFNSLKKEAEGVIMRFLDWRKDYEKFLNTIDDQEKLLRQDDVADNAMEILNIDEEDDENRQTDTATCKASQ